MTLGELQVHAQSRTLILPKRAAQLERELRNALVKASNRSVLRTAPQQIHQYMRVLAEPPPGVAEQLRKQDLHIGAYCIVGGDKNQDRSRDLHHFERDDGAWFDFTITVRESSKQLELLAYDFEIRLPFATGAPFLRFDLNLPDHRNEHRELRAHMHPGSDDIIVPSPMMSPFELVALSIDGLRPEADRPKPRAPSHFEVDWHGETHRKLAARRSSLAAATSID